MDSSTEGLDKFSIAVIVISSVSVVLRVWSRAVTPVSSLGIDDLTAYIAWALSVALCVVVIDARWRGLGQPPTELPLPVLTALNKRIFAGQILFSLSASFSKFSAVAFIERVFNARSSARLLWRLSFFSVASVVVASGFVFVMLDVFWCRPVSKFWEPLEPGVCMPTGPLLLPGAIVDVVIDVCILLLPMPQIFSLQATPTKKLLIAGLFVMGYSVVAISIGRLVAIVMQSQATGEAKSNFVPSLYWAIAEAGLSILVITLPAIFQLVKRARIFGLGALFSAAEPAASLHSQINFAHTARRKKDALNGADDDADDDEGRSCNSGKRYKDGARSADGSITPARASSGRRGGASNVEGEISSTTNANRLGTPSRRLGRQASGETRLFTPDPYPLDEYDDEDEGSGYGEQRDQIRMGSISKQRSGQQNGGETGNHT